MTEYHAGPPGEKYGRVPRLHPGEIPMLIIVILLTVLWFVGGLLLTIVGAVDWGNAGANQGKADEAFQLLQQGLAILAVPILFWILRGMMYAQSRVNGVKITETQFPEAYRMLVDAARHHRMRKVPDAYMINGNGQINAFASGHGFRRYAVFYSDLFDVGNRLKDPETFRYILGHELGHIAAGHTSYWRQVFTALMGVVPALGDTLSRAQEYTADNYGYSLTPVGSRGVTLLAAGKYQYPMTSFDELADRASTERGFFPFLVNLTSSHPVNVRRAAALRDRSKAGRLFFAEKPRPVPRPPHVWPQNPAGTTGP